MNLTLITLALCLVLMGASLQAFADTTLHVAPEGNDQWSGSAARPNAGKTDGPLASLQGARDAVRRLKAGKELTEAVRVVVAAGTYQVGEPVVFSPEDSGTPKAPVLYEAAPGAKPLFTGGRKLTGFKPGNNGVWTAQVPDVAAGKWYFEQLWVNGKRATRARTPNTHWFYTVDKIENGIDPETGQPAELSSRAFHARAEDLQSLLQVPKEKLNDVTLVAYHSWETSRSRLAAVDPKTDYVFVTHAIPWGFNQWGPRQRWHVENFKEALDAPGEWFLDRDGTLSYIPLPGEDMTTAEVIAPAGVEGFVRFTGQPELGLLVENLTLKGLSFQHSQYVLPPEGHGDGQAEVTIPAVITLEGARNIALDDCEVKHIGISGLWFRRGCRDCRVTRTYFADLGAGGVKIGEGWGVDLKDEAVHTGHCVVDNCLIHTGARIHHGAIGVWIGHSGDNQVTHNDISDFFYTLISAGWSWGYNPTLSHNNHIDFNHLHHTGWGMLSDMGGVYTLGLSDGATVNNNVIHDVYSYDKYGRGGWGLYNDEGTSRITMENNLVYNVKTGTYHQHYGEDNVVRNNIMAFSMDGQIQRSRIEDHNSFFLTNNLIYWKDGELYASGGGFKDEHVVSESNLYWKVGGEVTFHGETLADWQAKGKEKGSIVADPLFVDPENGDFHLKPGSPAAKVDFKPFDYTKAGLYGDPAWVSIPKGFQFPAVDFGPPPPPPPPLAIDDDFETSPVGSKPAKAAQVYTEDKGASIGVTDELAATGKQCLKIVDCAGNEHDYDPHFAYVPSYTSGTATCSFDMRIGEGVRMYHEWRSWDVQPYRTGPSIWIENNALKVGGKELLPLPVDQWFHVEVTAKVGDDADGAWTLTVTLPGKDPQRFDNLNTGAPDFRNLTWVGWSSMATEATVYYLDTVKLGNPAP
ncbi:MAG: DUF5123 domain-containing protein [Armatimonadetes bacterium]|nr:DUF5123 domain-containing protein [Armatimonadota bacterium]NCQ30732.1 DUF5123 domain-containing protein [Armatimonadota bacterium]